MGFSGFGADDRNRTDDLRITNALLYQLSYIGFQEAKFYSTLMPSGNFQRRFYCSLNAGYYAEYSIRYRLECR
ncbi:MAG: hypothetical protein RLZZ298_1703 [Pseudomonadota bacterium]